MKKKTKTYKSKLSPDNYWATMGTGLPIDPSSLPVNNVPQATDHYGGEQLGQTPFE